ncbi:MAG: hypothetical protein ABIO94_00895 [Opitutaceae bacterium]
MKFKPDWIALGAVLSIGYLMRLMFISDFLIFPTFVTAIALQIVVSRTARQS